MRCMKNPNNIQTWKLETAHVTTVPSTLLSTLFTTTFIGASRTARSAAFLLLTLGVLTLAGCGQRSAMASGQHTLSGLTTFGHTQKSFKNFCQHNQIRSDNFGPGETTIS
jgi:hypothetical protein